MPVHPARLLPLTTSLVWNVLGVAIDCDPPHMKGIAQGIGWPTGARIAPTGSIYKSLMMGRISSPR